MEGSQDRRELVINFANNNQGVAQLQFIRDDPEGVRIEPSGKGLVNYLIFVRSLDDKLSVVLKYGEEEMKMAPEEKLSLDRQTLEYNCLQLMHKIQPGCAPECYCLDTKYHILAMSDMSDWDLLGALVLDRQIDLEAATNLGQVLGRLHRETSQDHVSKDQWQNLEKTFCPTDHIWYRRDLGLVRLFTEKDTMNAIPESLLSDYRRYVTQIKALGIEEKLINTFNMQQCLIHGDCHHNSVFTNNSKVALFDFEFSSLGHPAYDLGNPVANHIMNYIVNEGRTAKRTLNAEYRTSCKKAVRNIVEGYISIQKEIGNNDASHTQFIADLAMFVGSMLFFMSVFTAMGDVVDGFNEDDRTQLLHVGFKYLIHHEDMKSLDQFVDGIYFPYSAQ